MANRRRPATGRFDDFSISFANYRCQSCLGQSQLEAKSAKVMVVLIGLLIAICFCGTYKASSRVGSSLLRLVIADERTMPKLFRRLSTQSAGRCGGQRSEAKAQQPLLISFRPDSSDFL